MGVFVGLETPTRGMYKEAATHGFYAYGDHQFPKIQLLTIEEILDGRRPALPAGAANVSLEHREVKTARNDQRGKVMDGLFDPL